MERTTRQRDAIKAVRSLRGLAPRGFMVERHELTHYRWCTDCGRAPARESR